MERTKFKTNENIIQFDVELFKKLGAATVVMLSYLIPFENKVWSYFELSCPFLNKKENDAAKKVLAERGILKMETVKEGGIYCTLDWVLFLDRFRDHYLTYNIITPKDKTKTIFSVFTLVNTKKDEKRQKETAPLYSHNSSIFEDIDEEWNKIIQIWLDYKKEKNQTYKSSKSIEILLKRLKKISNNNLQQAAEFVENSMSNNYSGIFPIRDNNQKSNNKIGKISKKPPIKIDGFI